MKEIIENATILQKNGVKQIYDAIHITKRGIYTGHIITTAEEGEVFEDHRFIPRDQIEKITVYTKQGKSKDIDLYQQRRKGVKIDRKGGWQKFLLFPFFVSVYSGIIAMPFLLL
jgi:hypothetical protein